MMKRNACIRILLGMMIAVLAVCQSVGAQARAGRLRIADSVKVVEASAFEGDTSFNEIYIGSGLRRIESRAFANTNVELIHFNSALTYIAPDAFEGVGEFSYTAPVGSYAAHWLYENREQFNAIPESDFTFAVEGDTATLTGYTGAETNIAIPASLGGYPVTTIGEGAFQSGSLKGVTLPDSVTTIAVNAFQDCANLRYVGFGAGLKTVGDYEFQNCRYLSGVYLPEGVETIGNYAFQNGGNCMP